MNSHYETKIRWSNNCFIFIVAILSTGVIIFILLTFLVLKYWEYLGIVGPYLLLMPWLLMSPSHQPPWCWIVHNKWVLVYNIEGFQLHAPFFVLRNDTKRKHIFMLPKNIYKIYGWMHRQTQESTIPEGQNWPEVKIGRRCFPEDNNKLWYILIYMQAISMGPSSKPLRTPARHLWASIYLQ